MVHVRHEHGDPNEVKKYEWIGETKDEATRNVMELAIQWELYYNTRNKIKK